MVLSNVVSVELFNGVVKVNEFTAPGWLLTFMFAIDLVMVKYLFTDEATEPKKEKEEEYLSQNINGSDVPEEDENDRLLSDEKKDEQGTYGGVDKGDDDVEALDAEVESDEPPPPLPLVLSLIFVQFSLMCGFSLLETVTSLLVADEFGWDVQACNLLFTAGGFISLTAYVVFVLMSRCVQDRKLVVSSLALSFLGFLLGIDWHQLDWVPEFVDVLLPSYLVRFLLGYALMNAGFMTGRPVTFALYSKLIARQYQGTYLGWMVAGGSAARTCGPFAAVALYYGVKGAGENLLALFGSFVLFHSACIVLVVWQWPHLLPKDSEPELDLASPASSEEKIQLSIRQSLRAVPANPINKMSYEDRQKLFQHAGSSMLTM